MVTFICEAEDCVNKDVQYNFLGNPPMAYCGGCKATLIGTDERPDPEIAAYTFSFQNPE